MAQSAAELQYLQSSYKEMQEQMSKQKDKTMAANAVRTLASVTSTKPSRAEDQGAQPPHGIRGGEASGRRNTSSWSRNLRRA